MFVFNDVPFFRERLVEAFFFFAVFSRNLIMFRLRRDVISHNSRLQAIFGLVFVSRLSVNFVADSRNFEECRFPNFNFAAN